MNPAQRNNNPVNLKIPHPVGEATEVDEKGFAVFPTPFAGWRAAHRQIKTDQMRGLSLREYIFKFAPPNENNTNDYLSFVCAHLRCSPDKPILEISSFALAGIQAAIEGYYNKE